MFLLIRQVCSLLMWLPGLLFWTYPILSQQDRLGTLLSHSRKTWCSLGMLIPEPHFSSVSVAGNVQGLALGFVLSVYCVCSLSGLQRHKSSCTGVGPSVDRTVEYSCNDCQRTFGEKRYLTQHIGGRKCQQRKELLTKSTSFTLALTASPST